MSGPANQLRERPSSLGRAIVEELNRRSGFQPLVIGQRYHYQGRIVEITSGQYWGDDGLSNFWEWRTVRNDGTLGPRQSGYDNKDEFKPVP